MCSDFEVDDPQALRLSSSPHVNLTCQETVGFSRQKANRGPGQETLVSSEALESAVKAEISDEANISFKANIFFETNFPLGKLF